MRNIFIASIVFSLTIFVFATESCNAPVKEVNAGEIPGRSDSLDKLVERGRYLATHVAQCVDCHSKRDFTMFAGPVVEGSEGMGGEEFGPNIGIPGTIYSANISSDTANGIGKWSDEDIVRALTRGIRPNGDTLFPLMPYPHFNTLHKDDVMAVIAYVRTFKPSSNKVTPRQLMIPISMAYPPMRSTALETNPAPTEDDPVKYGEYLVNAAVCMDCHTPMERGQFIMPKYMAGGHNFKMETFEVNSANITPDSATGIGKWTEEVFVDKFKVYRDKATYAKNPARNNTIMPWTTYAGMKDSDLRAIYQYLRSIPPVNNVVVKYPAN